MLFRKVYRSIYSHVYIVKMIGTKYIQKDHGNLHGNGTGITEIQYTLS